MSGSSVMMKVSCEFRKAVNIAYGQGGLKLGINIANSAAYFSKK